MVTHVRIGDVDEGTLSRLASKARQDGIKLFRDNRGRYFASSASKPGTMHHLTGYSCDCLGFVTHGRCKHHAALMSALGWIDGTPEPTPPATSTCPACHGSGSVPATIATGRHSWTYGSETCWTCHGSGALAAAA